MVELIYCNEATARELGLTHEGRIFGVPAWLGDLDSGDSVVCITKIPVLMLYTHFCSMLYDFAAALSGQSLHIPLFVGRKL
jgi:hypothetical protein